VSYIAVDDTFSGTLPQRLFLQDFEPVTERKKKTRTIFIVTLLGAGFVV